MALVEQGHDRVVAGGRRQPNEDPQMLRMSGVSTDRTRPSIASRLVRLALDLAIVALVLVVLTGVVLGRIVPLLGDSTYMISSGSMAPSIPVGTAVVVEPDATDVAVGDVISVRLSGSNVYTHRVTRIVDRDGKTWFETKGDANKDHDPAIVPATSVVGRVVASLPLAGYLLRLMSMPSGIALLVGFGAMLVVASWLVEAEDDLVGTLKRQQPMVQAPSEGVAAPAAGSD